MQSQHIVTAQNCFNVDICDHVNIYKRKNRSVLLHETFSMKLVKFEPTWILASRNWQARVDPEPGFAKQSESVVVPFGLQAFSGFLLKSALWCTARVCAFHLLPVTRIALYLAFLRYACLFCLPENCGLCWNRTPGEHLRLERFWATKIVEIHDHPSDS